MHVPAPFAAADPAGRPTSRGRRWLRRACKAALWLTGGYLLVVLVGLIPINNGFVPAEEGVTVYFVSTAVHADVVMPLQHEVIDWRARFPSSCFKSSTDWATHVSIGWGDQGFFLETPEWSDLKASTVAHALLWPSPSCMHVSCTAPLYLGQGARRVTISHTQYAQLVHFVLGSFADAERLPATQLVGEAYGPYDAFFPALGTYHACYTCNSWVGQAMATAGIRVGWLTPLPKTPFLYLP
jgi:uncharacterized protein (TIGR02117 family)